MLDTVHSGKITVEISEEKLIILLTKELKGLCYCKFDSLKPELKKLKNLINKCWKEPVDPSCIE